MHDLNIIYKVCIIPLFSIVILLPSSGHSISDTIETGIRRNL